MYLRLYRRTYTFILTAKLHSKTVFFFFLNWSLRSILKFSVSYQIDHEKLILLFCCNVAKHKPDQEILKSDFYQTIFLPKIRPKADPNSLFLRSKSDLFPKPNSDMRQINFYLKNPTFTKIIKQLTLCVDGQKGENQTLLDLLGQNRTFQAKRGPI